jgi:low temperature requirement protein LtrA
VIVRGIDLPERTEDFTADPVELFFDLAYVFAFSQMVQVLVEDPSWITAGKLSVLFVLLWLPWSQFTWSANAVSGNGRPVRLLFLIGTAASVPMAASTSTAFGTGGPVFAIAVGVIYLLAVVTMGLGLETGSAVHQSLVRWVAPNAVGIAILVIGAFLDGSARVTLWVLTLLIALGAMLGAGQSEWIVRSAHFAERHGLIVIIALGEVIVAIGVPVVSSLEEGAGLPGLTVVSLVASGVFAGLMWWAYFDRLGPALEHRGERIEGDRERGRYVRDVYTWGHAPVVAGIILAAAALEQITLHPGEAVAGSFRLMFFAAMALVVAGATGGVWRAYRTVPRERVVSTVAVGAMLLVAGSWDGVVLLVAIDAVIAITLLVEHRRIER